MWTNQQFKRRGRAEEYESNPCSHILCDAGRRVRSQRLSGRGGTQYGCSACFEQDLALGVNNHTGRKDSRSESGALYYLDVDNRLQVRFDCNRGSGEFTIAAGQCHSVRCWRRAGRASRIRLMGYSCGICNGWSRSSFRMSIFTWSFRPTAAPCGFGRLRRVRRQVIFLRSVQMKGS